MGWVWIIHLNKILYGHGNTRIDKQKKQSYFSWGSCLSTWRDSKEPPFQLSIWAIDAVIFHLQVKQMSDSANCIQDLSPSLVLFQAPPRSQPVSAHFGLSFKNPSLSKVFQHYTQSADKFIFIFLFYFFINSFFKKRCEHLLCMFWAHNTKMSKTCSQSFAW